MIPIDPDLNLILVAIRAGILSAGVFVLIWFIYWLPSRGKALKELSKVAYYKVLGLSVLISVVFGVILEMVL